MSARWRLGSPWRDEGKRDVFVVVFLPGLDMIQKNGGFCCFYPKLAWIKRQRIPVSPIEKFEKAVWVKDLNYMTKGLNRIHAASKFIFPSTVRPAAVTYSSGSSHKKIGLQKKLSFCRADHHTPEPWHTRFSGLSWLFHRAFSVFCFIFLAQFYYSRKSGR